MCIRDSRAADKIKTAIRHRDTAKALFERPPPPRPDVDTGLTLRQLLKTLPPEEQALMRLFYVQGFTAGEIGAGLGIPAGTVKSRLFHIRKNLQHASDQKGDQNE